MGSASRTTQILWHSGHPPRKRESNLLTAARDLKPAQPTRTLDRESARRLKRVTDAEQGRFIEVLSEKLQPNWEAFPVFPHGIEMPGIPARLAVMVKISERYMAKGSLLFSPNRKGGVGDVGDAMTSTWARAFSKSCLMSVRTSGPSDNRHRSSRSLEQKCQG
jgi:hypothetical protein